MKIELNREFFVRHLFVTVVFAALGGWFGYDGLVRYPATPADELYRSIEKSAAPQGTDLAAFKRQKIETQYGFSALALLAALAVGAHLFAVSRFRGEFDDDGFGVNGARFKWGEVSEVDDRLWGMKGITRVTAKGRVFKFDAWHSTGVKEFHERLAGAVRINKDVKEA